MFLRAVKTRKADPVEPAKDATPAYYTPEIETKKLRELSVIEQMYGYWTND
ncbi:hypothetical protein [Gemmobacter caeruleus]|uniref:hypothetical protein n=1 Tax=Gemmobacter caeruleus TaxID=2595004 RepID=UPI00139682BB|nr:hypothetical protein [Gemmobacter caeruleus]